MPPPQHCYICSIIAQIARIVMFLQLFVSALPIFLACLCFRFARIHRLLRFS